MVATATGLALAATHLLRGLDYEILVAFLASTYIAWGAGLRVNLAANARLLERTGTSTNALSKAAYDLVRARTGSLRAQRFAAGTGYVAAELAKEIPYYAGAFAVLLTDTMTAKDALIFLGGANLGAAAYEYGLGRLTRAVLDRGYASFEHDWVPGEYLADYYSEVEPDELETIAFFVDAMREVEPGEPVLFFGVGPTLHHVFLAAPHASEIHLADYLPANLREIERWLARDPGAHDWRPFVRYTLQCEGIEAPTDAATDRARGAHARAGHAAARGRRSAPGAARAALRDGGQRLLRRLGHRRPGGLADVHAAHRRARASGRSVRHRRAAQLPPLRRRRQAVPERGRRRARPARRADPALRARDRRCAPAGRARGAGLLGHRPRLGALRFGYPYPGTEVVLPGHPSAYPAVARRVRLGAWIA